VSDYIDAYQVTTIFTSKALATRKRALVQRFLAAFEQGVDTYNAALVDKTLSPAETDEVVAMIHKYVYNGDPLDKAAPRIKAGAMRISPKGRLNLQSVADQLAWFKSEKLVPPGVTLAKLVDTSFVASN
jgi:NitT/TauT family transport system substrate-binding protein